jgi:DNA-binding NtrC family response regulator
MDPAIHVTAERQALRAPARPMHLVLVPERDSGVENEAIAARSNASLLITASTQRDVEIVARRVHQTARATLAPFVRFRARALPIEPRMLEDSCRGLFDAATGGSVFLTDVEEMPPIVQDAFAELLADLQRSPSRSSARLITGTTVSLLDRVAAGTFSARLFYRLNVIHLVY